MKNTSTKFEKSDVPLSKSTIEKLIGIYDLQCGVSADIIGSDLPALNISGSFKGNANILCNEMYAERRMRTALGKVGTKRHYLQSAVYCVALPGVGDESGTVVPIESLNGPLMSAFILETVINTAAARALEKMSSEIVVDTGVEHDVFKDMCLDTLKKNIKPHVSMVHYQVKENPSNSMVNSDYKIYEYGVAISEKLITTISSLGSEAEDKFFNYLQTNIDSKLDAKNQNLNNDVKTYIDTEIGKSFYSEATGARFLLENSLELRDKFKGLFKQLLFGITDDKFATMAINLFNINGFNSPFISQKEMTSRMIDDLKSGNFVVDLRALYEQKISPFTVLINYVNEVNRNEGLAFLKDDLFLMENTNRLRFSR